MASIREVAKTAGVSIATVSRVMNGADNVDPTLRRNVLKAVDDCAYRPAVRRTRNQTIGLVYTGRWSLAGPYDAACLDGMAEAMSETEFDLCLLDLGRDRAGGESLQQFCDRKGVAALIARNTAEQRPELLRMAEEGVPVVVLGDHFECPALRFVYADSTPASREAMEHLIALGHTRIAFASCERDDGDHLDRLRAYREVLSTHGLLDDRLVKRLPPHRADGRQLLRNLVSASDRPTAVFIADPLVAVGAMIECHDLGLRLGSDLSLVGFDDDDQTSTVWPRMTAVRQDSRSLGRTAFQLAVAAAKDPRNRDDRTYEAWLDVGDTTGPAPSEIKPVIRGPRHKN
ncbi:Catabolite control protein A [Botrimarina colliarenosi]|uniref:Catabolite control protein A n=1 Tax=Botrimarina colliarenosi TaxID=2528001 RepID=A0A5C6AEA9_9BACT|nr:LacI family DNA-binding transcriptional regulator [Botrimarina colliarenosi]TWT97747.1 Catabolite control protein A [Botrimarina colliarenosi]